MPHRLVDSRRSTPAQSRLGDREVQTYGQMYIVLRKLDARCYCRVGRQEVAYLHSVGRKLYEEYGAGVARQTVIKADGPSAVGGSEP